ncbi:acyltransferase family protein [Ectobacillus funiculus]|uniref:acyltransferase family protein n=1 Tax=Ectobacillus funiculus TaxID=137993 RepID=UPI00101C26CC|nr:acyltransferase family protein [Ectobacillus funiculus]
MIDAKRETWLDAAKGFAMILVVAGHAYNHNDFITYIYWFHMPAFFLFSGYVSKPITQWSQMRFYIKKRAHSLLIPYFTYLGIFTAFRYIGELTHGNFSFSWYMKDIGSLLVGGRFITSYYGVFWFITCLFFTQLLFQVIFLLFKRTTARLLFILAFYIVSHIEGWYVGTLDGSEPSLHVFVPWNVDTSMLALCYYSIGYYAKTYLKQIPALLTGMCTLLTAGCITLQECNLLDYHLSIKYLVFGNYILDLFIPFIMIISYCGIFQLIKSVKIVSLLSFINHRGLIIMYLHIGINKILLQFIDYGNILYTILGVSIPLFISILLIENKHKIRAFLLHFLHIHAKHSTKLNVEYKEFR